MISATTDHLDRIDSAIIDRPSRFDRKYHFNLPGVEERYAYLNNWQRSLASEMGWQPEQVQIVAQATDGYSFAYLKDLVVSSVMNWMRDSNNVYVAVILAQSVILRQQMRTETATTAAALHECD